MKIKENSKKEEIVEFNVVMQKEFRPGPEVYKKLSGIYEMNDETLMEFYKDGDMLFVKRNGQIIEGLVYKGNNTFGSGTKDLKVVFEPREGGKVKVKINYFNAFSNKDVNLEGMKTFKY